MWFFRILYVLFMIVAMVFLLLLFVVAGLALLI